MWLKNIRHKKLQLIMIFLIIMICTTLLAGAISILTSLEKPYQDFARKCNAAAAKVYPFDESDAAAYDMKEQFLSLPNVKDVELTRKHYVEENLLFNEKKAEIFVNLTEYNEDIFGSVLYIEGNHNISQTLQEDECILPACISNEFDMHIGDTVRLQLADQEFNYRVAAVYTDPYQTSTAFDSDILINKLPPVEGRLILYIFGNENVAGTQIEAAFREKHSGKLNASLFALEDRISNGLVVGQIIGAMLLAIGIIILLVSGLMIHFMIKNTMITDAKSIAVYKTMGYTSKDILFMYLKMYFVVVTMACILGMLCSVFVSNTILTSTFKNLGQLKASNSILSGILCYFVIVSFVILVITVIISKAKRIKPVHALNGTNYGGIKKKKKYKGNSNFQFSAFGIAYRTFTREKRSAVGIIIASIVTVFSVNFIVISLDVANSAKENNDFWIGIDKADAMIAISESADYDFIKEVVDNDSRTKRSLSSSFLERVTMDWEKGKEITSMDAFVYDDYSVTGLPLTEGENPKNKNEIAISTTVSKSLGKSIGDYLAIYLDGEKRADLLITGLFQTYMQFGSMCRLTTSAYTEHNCDFAYNNLSIYLKDGGDTEAFIEDMKSKIGGRGNVIRRTEQYGSIMNMIVTPQQKVLPLVAALIIAIAGLNIFSIIFLKNIKLQKINGIYKCIGYNTWHLIASNLWYVTVIAAVTVVITLPVSILTYSPIMKLALSMLNFMEYPMTYQISHLLVANIAVVIIFVIGTLASSKALFQVNARDLIQE